MKNVCVAGFARRAAAGAMRPKASVAQWLSPCARAKAKGECVQVMENSLIFTLSDGPPICKSNGFALHRKPKGVRITLNAASICGILVYHILIGGHQCHSIEEGYTRKAL